MTTVAYRNGVMVADGRVTAFDRIEGDDFVKVFNINGLLVGGAGSATSIMKFVDWVEKLTQTQIAQSLFVDGTVNIVPPENIKEEDFTALIVSEEDGIVQYYGGENFIRWDKEYVAIGSGADYALAVMDAGFDAEKAVEIAMQRDVYSGGQITKVTFDDIDDDGLFSHMTEEDLNKMTKKELIALFLGEDAEEEKVETVKEESPKKKATKSTKAKKTDKKDTKDPIDNF